MHPAPLALLFALLALHRPPQPHRGCIERTQAAIVAAGVEAESIGVPASVFFAVARRESHFACAPGERSWGAPAPQSRTHAVDWRHRAGTPMDAARALRRSFEACGDWRAAVSRFRSGLCRAWQPGHRAYVASVMRDVSTIDPQFTTPQEPR